MFFSQSGFLKNSPEILNETNSPAYVSSNCKSSNIVSEPVQEVQVIVESASEDTCFEESEDYPFNVVFDPIMFPDGFRIERNASLMCKLYLSVFCEIPIRMSELFRKPEAGSWYCEFLELIVA